MLPRYHVSQLARIAFSICIISCSALSVLRAEDVDSTLSKELDREIRPLLKTYCFQCHGDDLSEGEVNYESMVEWQQVRGSTRVWQRASEMLHSDQMPPPDAKQPSASERKLLSSWVQRLLSHEASKFAGDPGPVVLRRLNNAEFNYTIHDLTGLDGLNPTREFPVDSAAGEGFTNSGTALVMSPALVRKYLDAAKEIASHAVLLPDGIRFSMNPSRSDLTNDSLERIRSLYRRYTDNSGGETVNLQGVIFETNQGGRLPVEKYLTALVLDRESLQRGAQSIEQVANSRQLNAKYLASLWSLLNGPPDTNADAVMANIRHRWRDAKPDQVNELIREVAGWQKALWKFSSIGHIGKVNGPKSWQEPVNPVTDSQDLRLAVPNAPDDQDVVFYLQVTDAGDGNQGDHTIIDNPRLVAAGRPDIALVDVPSMARKLESERKQFSETIVPALEAIESLSNHPDISIEELSKQHQVPTHVLVGWQSYLGIGMPGITRERIMQKGENLSGYEKIDGWVGADALSVIANASDELVHIPGAMKPHSVAVHPAPSRRVCVGWNAIDAMSVSVNATVQSAHAVCGNGVAWSVELRRGKVRQVLGSGFSAGFQVVPIGPFESLRVHPGDQICLIVDPRDGNHSCDLTTIDLAIKNGDKEWSLTRDVSSNMLDANPHSDSFGNAGVWEFFHEPTNANLGTVIPNGSLLAQWLNEPKQVQRTAVAKSISDLMQASTSPAGNTPDAELYRQLISVVGPIFYAASHAAKVKSTSPSDEPNLRYGVDKRLFVESNGNKVNRLSLQAPALIEIRLPASLAANTEFLATAKLHPTDGIDGSVQFQLSATKPAVGQAIVPGTDVRVAEGTWSSNNQRVQLSSPIVANNDSKARKRIESSFEGFRRWFPIALCYPKIVPVDEVVTLTLFYREDDQLARLMLSDDEKNGLNRLWDELHFVSQDALRQVDAYEQLWQFATQDADPSAFEPLRIPFQQAAEKFRLFQKQCEPTHIKAVIGFASQAYRRALRSDEGERMLQLYQALLRDEMGHDEAIRFMIARVLVSPEFLYKLEVASDGKTSRAVTAHELATRLSYFLWSSMPDEILLQSARSGKLLEPDELIAQARRMLSDNKARRLAIEFGCQWLHVRDFDQFDEKSESHFPEFKALRNDIYEETIRTFQDLLRNNRSITNLIDGNEIEVNGRLAAYYGIANVTGDEWRRLGDAKNHGRGGILTLASTLSKQAGASRTSPILRGTWLSEVILGERLPKPPAGVPQLAEVPPTNLTERKMVERHSRDPACAKCHIRIDPFGFALESYDAIGRLRSKDANGLSINTATSLLDGTQLDGVQSLRSYLLGPRRRDVLMQFHKKLLGFALGRGVRLSDEPLLAQMVDSKDGDPVPIWNSIEKIVLSKQFREIRGREFDTSDE